MVNFHFLILKIIKGLQIQILLLDPILDFTVKLAWQLKLLTILNDNYIFRDAGGELEIFYFIKIASINPIYPNFEIIIGLEDFMVMMKIVLCNFL